jgi:hypothetical protein
LDPGQRLGRPTNSALKSSKRFLSAQAELWSVEIGFTMACDADRRGSAWFRV